MDKAFVKKWVEALESGRYRQTKGTLCRVNNKKYSYCCLGVAARVFGKKNIDGGFLGTDDVSGEYSDVAVAAGLHEIDEERLAKMNDEGSTFTEIAKWIRKNILKENA